MDYDLQNNICVITTPLSDASITPVSNLINILSSLSQNMYFITGNSGSDLFNKNKKISTYSITYKLGTSISSKIINYASLQIKILSFLFKLRKNIDVCFFFIGSNNIVLPIIIAKLLNKKVILVLPGSSNMLKFANDPFYHVVKIFETINLFLSDIIILYSSSLIKNWELEKYINKIVIARRHFLDLEKFKIVKNFDEKSNCIGYIGRLSGEKGIFNLVKAIPTIINECNDVEFFIIGDGDLKEKINSYLSEHDLCNNVKILGWIPHDELPVYLNKFKLVVLPSYTEGLPNVMLESMACGTPVLATSVGAIPDIIQDGITGFIMENNSPECIANNVHRVFKHPNLEKIVWNGRELIMKEFTFEVAVEKYRKLLTDIALNKL